MAPVAINVTVAMIERFDSLEMPHTPCPLVQPFPRTDPNPTKMPAKPSSVVLLDMTAAGAFPKMPNQSGAVTNRPTMKVTPCRNPLVSTAGGRTLETMPLIPAIRPWLAIRMTADSPISAPPNNDAIGVNSVSNIKLLILFTKTVTYCSTPLLTIHLLSFI